MRRALSFVAGFGLWMSSSVALADAVPAPPDDCPEGQVGITGHGGPACVPEAPKDCAPGYRGQVGGICVLAACAADQECESGTRCVQVDTCQELRQLNWSGWGWSAERLRAATGNALAGPPMVAPPGDPPKAWVKLHICGQDAPCDSPAECRPMGLCYPTSAIGKTKAKIVSALPVKEELPDGVYPQSLIDSSRDPKGQRSTRRSSGCGRGCGVAATRESVAWLAIPLLGLARLRRRRASTNLLRARA